MLTLRQMRYFEALATARHFGRAAELVHVSQPALSAQIAAMETDLGSRLVERGRGKTLLTAEGEQLLPKIRRILEDVDALETGARRQTGVLEGPLRLGIIPTVAPYLAPALLKLLARRYPGLDLQLQESVTDTLLETLAVGELDAVLAALPIEDETLASKTIFRDPFWVAASAHGTHGLTSPVRQTALVNADLLLLAEGHCLRDQALEVCGIKGGKPRSGLGATSLTTLLQMVSHGMGVTLIPQIARKSERTNRSLNLLRFAEPQPGRTIGLIWRKRSQRKEDIDALAEGIGKAAESLLR